MSDRLRLSRLAPLGIFLAIVLGVGVGVGIWQLPFDRLAVWQWRVRLATADDTRAVVIIDQMAGCGRPGLDAVVALLAAPEASRVAAARAALDHLLGSWPELDPASRAERQLWLAQALAAHVSDFSPSARRLASDLVLQILRDRQRVGGEQQRQLVAACAAVMRITNIERRRALLAAASRAASEPDEGDQPVNGEPLAAWHHRLMPGGGLPVDTKGLLFGNSTAPPEGDANASEDLLANTGDDHEPRILPEAAANEPAVGLPTVDDWARAHLGPDEASADIAGQPEKVEVTDTLRWMHALNSNDLLVRARAEEELAREGFTEFHMELARQLTNPDANVRRALAESLPAMPDIDARVWLVWLSRDDNTEVRLAAMAVMATTGDPSTMRRIEQMAREDSDPRVQRQGERLLGMRQSQNPSSGVRRVTR